MAFIQSEFRLGVAEDATVRANHGNLARESETIESCFDSVAHATIMAADRQELLSAERRLFDIAVPGAAIGLGLDLTGGNLPVAAYSDTERGIERSVVVAGFTVNLATQQTELRIWG
jgi:hypothetical protein